MRDNKKLNLRFYFDYAKKAHKKNRFLKNAIIFLCSLTIAFSAVVYNFGDEYIHEQEELLNEISSTEIFVVNKTTPLKLPLDLDENLAITQEESESIGTISEIEQVYPFFELRSFGYDIDLDTGITQSELRVIQNGDSREYSFDSDSSDEFDLLNIIPYYPEQKLEKRVGITGNGDVKEGVYISNQLAALLDIQDLDSGVCLNVDIYIPVMLYDTVMLVGEEDSAYDIDIDISKKINLDFELAGILNSTVINTYTSSGNNIIYAPYSLLQEILDENQKLYTRNAAENQGFEPWLPSAYVVFAKSYNDIQTTASKIASINPNFQSVSNYQDVDSMNKMMEATRNTGRWIVTIILSIIFLLMAVIYLNNTLKRRYEISVLKANGMTKTELFKLAMVESVRHVIWVTLISTVISFLLIWIVNLLFGSDVINFSVWIIVHNVLVSMLSILIPTIIAIVAINRFKPDKIMRN